MTNHQRKEKYIMKNNRNEAIKKLTALSEALSDCGIESELDTETDGVVILTIATYSVDSGEDVYVEIGGIESEGYNLSVIVEDAI